MSLIKRNFVMECRYNEGNASSGSSNTMQFIPGLKLSEYFHDDVVQPLMAEQYPGLSYSAARLDYGSDVLGFDTPMSMDHGWGPKLTLFLTEQDWPVYHTVLNDYFANHLPFEYRGFPTHFGEPLADGGVMSLIETYPIQHGITITTPELFFLEYLGVDLHQPLTPTVWLTIPQQHLRSLRAGRIFFDGLGNLSNLRVRFNWYPQDLWLYLMANQWQRISQIEPFVGRAGSAGDPLGARLIAARLIQDLMLLCFLMEKQFMPYIKWFGTAFQTLETATKLAPIFEETLNAENWQQIEAQLIKAYLVVMNAHNTLNITPVIEPEVFQFHDRPFSVPQSDRFVSALLAQIYDPAVRALPPHVGSLDQVVDNIDVLEDIQLCQRLKVLYQKTGD
jgi:hypothetical protein